MVCQRGFPASWLVAGGVGSGSGGSLVTLQIPLAQWQSPASPVIIISPCQRRDHGAHCCSRFPGPKMQLTHVQGSAEALSSFIPPQPVRYSSCDD